jgi:hypothetical protein
MTAPAPVFQPEYEPWRHGGWYVTNVHYPSGACGCVSRNYPDRKWRIVGHDEPGSITYATRDAAAKAENEIARVDRELAHAYAPGQNKRCLRCGGYEFSSQHPHINPVSA